VESGVHGLASTPSAFQRLVEQVVKGINNVVVYIDDLIIHSRTHEDLSERWMQFSLDWPPMT
jgi:hypothetical protein